VKKVFIFRPVRKSGFLFQSVVILLLASVSLWGIWRASLAAGRIEFLLFLLPSFVAVFVIPIFAYRLYALYGAYYSIERDGIRLHWGLRSVVIPMDVIEWVHPADDLEPKVPLPYLRWPGAVLGSRQLAGGGQIEFIASTTKNMLVISTYNHAYAISPKAYQEFRNTYRRFLELGSVEPLQAASVQPGFLFAKIWRNKWGRWLIVGGFLLNILLFLYSLIAISNLEFIHLGFYPDASPAALVPSVRLLLLPIIAGFFFVVDFLLGLFFFRIEEGREVAFLLWAFGIVTPILFFFGVYFILSSS